MPTFIRKFCPVCKLAFEIQIKRVNAGQGTYCSNTCAGKDKNHKPMSWVLIPLTKGQFTKVDVEDIQRLMPYAWRVTETTYGTYRAETHINRKPVRLYRFITNAEKDMDVHHINGDTLDNRKINLVVCTRSQHFKLGRVIHGG